MNQLEFRPDNVRQAVKAVRAMNPSAANYGEASLIDWVQEHGNKAFADGSLGYWACLGLVVTAWVDEAGKRHGLVSVDAYTAHKHIGADHV